MEVAGEDACQMLISALNLLDRDDACSVRQFFFETANPAADITLITNAAAVLNYVFLRSRAVSAPLPTTPPTVASIAKGTVTREILLLPCFTLDNISCGAVMFYARGSMLGGNLLIDDYACGRFVRDESSGETVIITRSLNESSFVPNFVITMRFLTSTTRQYIVVACDSLDLNSSRPGESPQICANATETHSCVVCGKPAVVTCGCTIPWTQPSHSTDLSAVCSNIRKFAGMELTGLVKFMLRRAKSADMLAVDATWVHSMQSENDFMSLARIQNIIVAKCSKRLHPNRFALKRNDMSSLQKARTKFLRAHLYGGRESGPVVVIDTTVGPPADRSDTLIDASWLPFSGSGKGDYLQETTFEESLGSPRHEVGGLLESGKTLTCEDHPDCENDPGSEDQQCQLLQLGQEHRMGRGNQPKVLVRAGTALSGKAGKVVNPNVDQERRQRTLARQQRNREAAARSNAMRKARLEELKKGLQEGHARVAELQKKEGVLRQENIMLRQLLDRND